MAEKRHWQRIKEVAGCLLRSTDVRNRRVGELPAILGYAPYMTQRAGAIYGLPSFDRALALFVSAGFNNDRDSLDLESFDRPNLAVGSVNSPLGPSLVAELSSLYQRNDGMLIKFVFDPVIETADAPHVQFPNGAGIREYRLHRLFPFQLIWSFDGREGSRPIPWPLCTRHQ